MDIILNEATAAQRYAYFLLRDATDGITAETGEAGGQPQVSTNGAAFTNTGIGVLVAIGSGWYYAEMTQTLCNGSVGDIILARYKSANTMEAEAVNGPFFIVEQDPYQLNTTIADQVWNENMAGHGSAGTYGMMFVGAKGTADSGSTTTMVDAALTQANDYWLGQIITFTSGTLFGVARLITDFDAATDTITFAPAAPAAVSTHNYTITTMGPAYAAAIGSTPVDDIADGVWDEAKSGHTSSGSFGDALQDAVAAVNQQLLTYETRRLGRQKVRYNDANDDNPLMYQLVVDGVKVTPTSATITIYAPGGTTALVSAANMTVSGTLMTYSVDTTTTASWPQDSGYRADIVVTYDSKTYPRTVIFDVAAYLLDLSVGVDQLVALDDGLRGMQWDGSETFGELIQATRDVLQTRIEARVIADDELLENMILDNSRVAVAGRFYMLQQIWAAKGDETKAEYYEKQYNSLMSAVLNTIKYDKSLSGFEVAREPTVTTTRLKM